MMKYSRGGQGFSARRSKGVERRATRLQGEYRRPQARLDQKYHATPAGQACTLQSRLEGFGILQGWVVGSFQ